MEAEGEEMSISRDAQIVAQSLFGMGIKSSTSFRRPHIIHPRTRAAIDELLVAGFIEPLPKGELPRGAEGWKATLKIGRPLFDFERCTEEESFPITT